MCETCGCQGTVSTVSSGSSASQTLPISPVSEMSSPPQPLAERVSDSLQHAIHVVVGAQHKPPRRIRSLLNGTVLGHPLHPAITDVPIGAWLIAAIFDIIWLIAPTSYAWAAKGALVAIVVGILGALGAAVTGLTDWSDTYGSERTIGLNHAIFNVTALVLYVVSLVLRFTQTSSDSVIAAVIGFIGLIAVLYAAYLGGEMVFTKGTAVNHTAWEAGSDDYEAVLPVEGTVENKLYRVTAAGVPVVLLRQGPQFFALSATCSHAGGPLDEGTLQGDIVECPWHGSRFCMRDGRVLTGPATAKQPRYDVRVRDGQVEVKRMGDH